MAGKPGIVTYPPNEFRSGEWLAFREKDLEWGTGETETAAIEDLEKRAARRIPDPKFQCAFIMKSGRRCKRMTTTIYCNDHARIADEMARGIYGLKEE